MRTNLSANKCGEAVLVLEDGSIFFGHGFGAVKKVSGEIVFSTSMVGYTESLTDPSYKGQILTLTYPLIGNYGVPSYPTNLDIPLCFESENIKAAGLIVHELCKKPYHWASTKTLDEWLKTENVPGISGIDTRTLTKKLRTKGVMLGILQVFEEGVTPNVSHLLDEVRRVKDPNLSDLVKEVSVDKPIIYGSDDHQTVVLIDCGAKNSILRNLLSRKLTVIKVPYDFSPEEILEYKPKGIIISNGPGDPKNCLKTIDCIRVLTDTNIPILGICLGNHILALASGGDTYKMKYGHRSQNQPVINLETGRCYITTQNHGFAVDAESLEQTDLKLWFINANDKTVEGVKHTKKKAFSIQFHPEHYPGPVDAEYLFNNYMKMLEGGGL